MVNTECNHKLIADIKKLYDFRDEETGTWECFDLASQGPCDEGEWFVLDDANASPHAICKPLRCENETIVWFEGRCVDINLPEGACPRGKELLANPFGEGKQAGRLHGN